MEIMYKELRKVLDQEYPRVLSKIRAPKNSRGSMPCVECGTFTVGRVEIQVTPQTKEMPRVCNHCQKHKLGKILRRYE